MYALAGRRRPIRYAWCVASARSGQRCPARKQGEEGGSNLFGRERMEGLVLLAAGRRCHSLRHGKDGAEVGGKPQRFGLTLTLVVLAHAQPDRHTRTPAGGYAGTHTSTTAPISATPARFSLGLHLGCVCRL